MSLSSHINEKANLIWAIADKLTGVYKPHEYGEVILPLTVIRRFDCILSSTKDAVLEKYQQVKDLPMRDILLRNASGFQFYNTSKYTFERLLDDPDNIEANFRDYLNGFSPNVQEIIEKFKFDGHITTMAQKNILFIVLKEFTTPKADLHPNHISNLEMGYIFEEIIRRFSEAHNEDAGQHYTPREVIELMVNILFYDDSEFLSGDTVAKTIYDPACGTGGMLSVAENYLHKLNAGAELLAFGQEINDQTFAICKADMLIKGNDATQIRSGNTLSDDQFAGQSFDYILSNPPFGREWKNEKDAVAKEAKLGFAGRFGAGLPAVGDGQMLFLETAISKMKPTGSRVAIIHNGSPLFTGDAGSGPSEIRRYSLENDLLEAIIALPNDIFYNTGIATYIWVLSNKKAPYRKGKVQLINANGLYEKRRKALGNKRNDISPEQIAEITRIYGDFKENEISKIFNNEEFGYYKITVERPLIGDDGKPVLKKGKPVADSALRDTENVPLTEDIEEYFKREVLPFAPDAWIDESKTKVGYEIPFTRYFYKFEAPEKSENIISGIESIHSETNKLFEDLLRNVEIHYNYDKYLIALIDVLGSRDIIRQRDEEITGLLLNALHKEFRQIIDETVEFDEVFNVNELNKYKFKVFSERIIIAKKCDKLSDNDVHNIAVTVSFLQARLWKRFRLLTRGGIVYGDCFIDDTIVMGSGIIDVNELESNKALYPRVILSEKLGIYANSLSFARDDYAHDPVDGYFYVDYINLIKKKYADPTEIQKDIDDIVCFMEKNKEDKRILQKYSWLYEKYKGENNA